MDKEMLRLVGITTAFCVVSAFLLAWTSNVTREPIEAARRAELNEALKKVLPPCDNDVVADAVRLPNSADGQEFFVARQGGRFVGVAFRCRSEEGYGGVIELLAGLTADGTIKGIEVLQAANETPGLGARIKEPAFRNQFAKRSGLKPEELAVKKDGGQIDAITGATISSRAVAKAVRSGLAAYASQAEALKAPKPEAPAPVPNPE